MGYTKITIKGISWVGGVRVVTRVISVARTAIVARILTPADFGFFAIASIVLALVELITETGINIVLTQKKEEIDKYINTAWTVSIIRGFIISAVIILSAPFVSSFFNSSQTMGLIMLVSIVPLVRGFINPSVVKFIKDLEFRKEFIYRVSVFSVESIITICWAYYFKNAESLVMGLIIGALFEVVMSFILVRPLPKISFDKDKFLEVLNKGKWLTTTGILNYAYGSGDDVVVGKILNATSLGLYDVAYRFSMLPITEVSDVVGKVTFPVYVKISEDVERLKKAYIKSLLLISLISIFIGFTLIIFPEQIIVIILGEKWLPAAPVLPVLAVVGMVRAIVFSITVPLYALGMQNKMTVITLVSFLGMAISIVPMVISFGLLGAAYSALIGTVVTIPYVIYISMNIFRKV